MGTDTLTWLEHASLAAKARAGHAQGGADLLGITLTSLEHAVVRAYGKLGVHSEGEAWAALGWLRVPVPRGTSSRWPRRRMEPITRRLRRYGGDRTHRKSVRDSVMSQPHR